MWRGKRGPSPNPKPQNYAKHSHGNVTRLFRKARREVYLNKGDGGHGQIHVVVLK